MYVLEEFGIAIVTMDPRRTIRMMNVNTLVRQCFNKAYSIGRYMNEKNYANRVFPLRGLVG